ncbi:CidB/LrgB family autolysis modulator [Glaesserella sp.]|uniref:CidB/LrgB family autolysis modulator n=1 Tax=Glaesserella sp. TaxID=2094731 RepID=UPI0035A1C926
MNNALIYGYSLLTLLAFFLGSRLSKRLKSSIFNPFIITLCLIVAVLLGANIPFDEYYQGNLPINNLLGVSVVALAVPFYEQLPQIRKHWKKITVIVVTATFLTMLSGILLAIAFGANHEIVASLLPKSVSTPIAIAIAKEIGGHSAISAVAVVIAGITGSAFGIAILQWLKVNNTRAIGLSMGAVSHALGTARSMEYSIKAGSYASVALVLCGILSSLIAPIMFKWVLRIWF